jgi:outer membrane receptor protein involved in Fe transport
MSKSLRFITACLFATMFSIVAIAQNATIKGIVINSASKEGVPAVSVSIKGTSQGTYTDDKGMFSLSSSTKFPYTLVFSSVGFESKELTVNNASAELAVDLVQISTLGEEVVMAANRTPQRILESPVTVERMSANALKNIAAPTYYEAIANLKGVDMHTASLTFKTVTTRGFVSSGNTRLNQIVDGMDNQAPGLNFSVSTIVGISEIDVDNIELLSGASSALYGSGGMNGTLLINSKNPFKYQGLSFNLKQGIMHVDGKQRNAAPYYNWSLRYAKAINNKLAFKINAEILKGADWQAEDYQNKIQTGIVSNVKDGNRFTDPNYNGINIYGDETSFNLDVFSKYVQDQINNGILAATGGQIDLVGLQNSYYGAIGNPKYPTNAQVAGFSTFPGFPPQLQAVLQSPAIAAQTSRMFPFYNGFKNQYFNNANVSRTGYNEEDLVDYNSLNVKINFGLHYKINDNIEASWNSYMGTGTTVYTGADRYSLKDFKVGQHKLEVRAKTWLVRGYTTQENAGNSYIAGALGSFMNEAARSSSDWFPFYITGFSETRRQSNGAIDDYTLHTTMRQTMDYGTTLGTTPLPGLPRFMPGTPQFDAAADQIKNTPVNKAGGSKFLDKSDLWATEAQVNLSDAAHFSDKIEVLMGASWKQWSLNSQGTIFADTAGAVKVNETGGYLQLKKKLFNDVLTLTGAVRYDVQSNFDGRWTPRITAVIKAAKDNYFRMSFQTAYRFPSNQNQYINLRLGGQSSFLIGSLPEFQTLYKLTASSPGGVTPLPGYTAASVNNYRAGPIGDSSKLVQAVYNPLTPEIVSSYEVGYKGLIAKKLLIDAYVYYSRYQDFILSTAVVQQTTENKTPTETHKNEVYSSFSSRNVSYNQNSDQTVRALGWGLGFEYQLPKKYVVFGNVFNDELNGVPTGEITFFNAPNYRFNIGLRNENIHHNIGFSIIYKWQGDNYYEGTFITGTLPSFGLVDLQISYSMPKSKSIIRFGATNFSNGYNRTGYGSPAVGGLYYMSYGYNL